MLIYVLFFKVGPIRLIHLLASQEEIWMLQTVFSVNLALRKVDVFSSFQFVLKHELGTGDAKSNNDSLTLI